MGLLDSNLVGQLTKQISASHITGSANKYLITDINVKGYDTILFRVTDHDSVLNDSVYITLNASITNTSLSSIRVYKETPLVNFNTGGISKITQGGDYIATDISDFSYAGFYIIANVSYDISIEYVLCNSNQMLKHLNTTISDIYTKVNAINTTLESVGTLNPLKEVSLGTTSFNLSSTGNHFITIPDTILGIYKGIKIGVVINQIDDNVKLYIDSPLGTNSESSRGNLIKMIDENGQIVFNIDAKTNKKLNTYYYVENINKKLNIRCNVAGASGLTCTVTYYATTYIPPIAHVHELDSKSVTLSSTGQYVNFYNVSNLQYFKFLFMTVEATSVSGTFNKNYYVGDDENTEIMSFSNQAKVCSEWIPVTFPVANFFAQQLAGEGTATVKIWGVV